jgi:hypothetical protein
MKKQKEKWADDGRTIVSMDVPGMPAPFLRRKRKIQNAQELTPVPMMDSRQTRRYTFVAVGAGLLVALVFIAVMVLFVLFAVNVWFK